MADQATNAYLITGSDPSLVSRALTELLAQLSPDEAAAEVEIHECADDAGLDIGPVLAALATPSWLSDRRIVVVRDAGQLVASQGAELAKAIGARPTDNILVLASPGKAVPQALSKAIKAHGSVIDSDPGRTSRARSDWVGEQLRHSSLHLDPAAVRRLAEHVGEDFARLVPILELLEAAHGSGQKIGVPELEPCLGEEGSAPPWDLTDAIDNGDGETAIRALRRLIGPGGRHPLQVLATLHRHVAGMLRLDGDDDVRSADDAASVLGMSAFPARKILDQGRRLGHDRIVRALEVLAETDADLRGRQGWPPELVMEVAVARLAQLGRSTSRPAPARARSNR